MPATLRHGRPSSLMKPHFTRGRLRGFAAGFASWRWQCPRPGCSVCMPAGLPHGLPFERMKPQFSRMLPPSSAASVPGSGRAFVCHLRAGGAIQAYNIEVPVSAVDPSRSRRRLDNILGRPRIACWACGLRDLQGAGLAVMVEFRPPGKRHLGHSRRACPCHSRTSYISSETTPL